MDSMKDQNGGSRKGPPMFGEIEASVCITRATRTARLIDLLVETNMVLQAKLCQFHVVGAVGSNINISNANKGKHRYSVHMNGRHTTFEGSELSLDLSASHRNLQS